MEKKQAQHQSTLQLQREMMKMMMQMQQTHQTAQTLISLAASITTAHAARLRSQQFQNSLIHMQLKTNGPHKLCIFHTCISLKVAFYLQGTTFLFITKQISELQKHDFALTRTLQRNLKAFLHMKCTRAFSFSYFLISHISLKFYNDNCRESLNHIQNTVQTNYWIPTA